MQNIRLPHASRIIRAAAISLGLLFLAGCASTLTNLTPDALTANPSQLYTFTFKYVPHDDVEPGTLKLRIIIDEQGHDMTPSATPGIYTYEYAAAPGQTSVRYYVLADYRSRNRNGVSVAMEDYTQVQSTKISSRYVLELEANRGPVGAAVGVLGRGFTSQDSVYLDRTPALTRYESPNALSFFVPGVASDRNYSVQISNPAGTTVAGTFHVDASTVSASPSSLNLRQGETQVLTFTVPIPASAGGQLVDVKTDNQDLVIMPVVTLPSGSTSISVRVKGGRPGSGTLSVAGTGLSIPVTVTP